MSDDEETNFTGGVRGCVILIDVSPVMCIEVEEVKPINVALESCLNLFRKMIIEAPKQLVGVSLYGTEKNDNKGIENVIEIIKLAEPTVEAITNIKDLFTNPDEIITKWGSTDSFNLADALWQGSKMFSGCKKLMNSQSVILMSAMGEPDLNMHRVILKKAKDLRELNIDISFVNLSNDDISANSFYVEIGKVIAENPDTEWELPEPVNSVEDVVPLLWSSHHRASAYACLKFLFSPDVYMGVKMYYLQKKKDKPKKIFLNRDTNEVIKSFSVTHAVGEEDSDNLSQESPEDRSQEPRGVDLSNVTPLNRSDITHTTTFGGRRICLSDSEMFALKTFAGHPCIKLLGFKSESALNMPERYLKNSAFLYPNESDLEGSTTLFLALRDRCLAQCRIPICLLIPRWRSHATPVALIPQNRVVANGRQVYPDGFHVVYLPYADDLKEVPIPEQTELTFDQKHCMENIVNKLKIRYDENTFENPTLQTFYKALEALALDENLQEIDDTTLPEAEEQNERLGDLINKFNEVFGSMAQGPVKRTQSASDKPSKKQAIDPAVIDVDMIKDSLNGDRVHKCTVAQLKQMLKCDTISTSPALTGLKKDQLVDLVKKNKDNILWCVSKLK